MNIINIPQPPININEHEYNRLLGLKYNKRDAFLEYLKKRYKRIRYNIILNKIELINWENKEEIFEDRLINEWYLDLSYNEEYLVPIRKDGSQYHYPPTVLDYAAELRSFQSYYKTTNVKMSLQELHCIINNEVTTPSYNPVKEIFELLKVMVTDVKEPTELNKFIKCFKCNKQSDELVRMYFYSWVSGVFRNCLELDKKAYDAILIFKSKQGDGKSKAIEEHFLKMFNKYFTSTFNWSTSDKDELLKLSSNIFIYDDELTATTKGKIEDIKKITSMRSLNSIRAAYERIAQNYQRRCSFLGATNSDIIINDDTGSRRFLALNIESINLKGIEEINYEILWAECYHYFYLQQNVIYLDFEKINESNSVFKEKSLEEEFLEQHFNLTNATNYTHEMTGTEIITYLIEKGCHIKLEQRTLKKIATVLRQQGVPFKTNIRINGVMKGCVYYLEAINPKHKHVFVEENEFNRIFKNQFNK